MRASLFILVLLATKSCPDPPGFLAPQPEGSANEKYIPKKLRGEFEKVGFNDSTLVSSILTIHENKAISHEEFRSKAAVHEMGPEFVHAVDSIRALFNGKDSVLQADDKENTRFKFGSDSIMYIYDDNDLQFRIKGDSIYMEKSTIDTTIQLSARQLLRRYKNDYYLSSRTDTIWYVQRISIHGDTIIFGGLTESDAKQLRFLTGITNDTTIYFRPSTKQWSKFVKEGGFGSQKKYVRKKNVKKVTP